jgi:hypothetical protein
MALALLPPLLLLLLLLLSGRLCKPGSVTSRPGNVRYAACLLPTCPLWRGCASCSPCHPWHCTRDHLPFLSPPPPTTLTHVRNPDALQRALELQQYRELGPDFERLAKQYGTLQETIRTKRELLQRVRRANGEGGGGV